MGVSHSIHIVLDLKYEKNNMDHIFKQCIENNMRLYPDSFDNLNELDSSGAATRILTVELEEEERCVRAKFQDTDFSIWIFKEKNNLLSFSIGDFGIKWRKRFINGRYDIDFARYIRLLLRVCKDFTILALETSAF